MSYAAMVTLALVGVIVVALAGYLVTILAILMRIAGTLGKITFAVRAIAHRTEPIGPAVDGMNGELAAVADGLEQLVTRTSSGAAVATARR